MHTDIAAATSSSSPIPLLSKDLIFNNLIFGAAPAIPVIPLLVSAPAIPPTKVP
jgi:hypothetical protein